MLINLGNQKGMSLIELLTSLMIIGMVIFPVLNLFRHSGILTALARHEITALNYAQEIIEGVKSVHDNHTGLVQGIEDETIILEERTSSEDNAYNNHFIAITGGRGSGQVRTITGYDGGSHTATVDQSWTTPLPEINESSYLLLEGFDKRFDFKISLAPGDINLKTVRATVYYQVNDQLREISLTTEKLVR
jgi:prepilin-type N-terminal cleavage/methylation domain-containing protein